MTSDIAGVLMLVSAAVAAVVAERSYRDWMAIGLWGSMAVAALGAFLAVVFAGYALAFLR